MGKVYAAAQGNAGWVGIHNLGQEPAEFGAAHENVIGPFKENPALGKRPETSSCTAIAATKLIWAAAAAREAAV